MKDWSFGRETRGPEWPKTVSGENVPPAFLTHIDGSAVDIEMTKSLLMAYSVPYTLVYPGEGILGKLLFGSPTAGVDVYVPETVLEDAQNLLSAEICEGEETD